MEALLKAWSGEHVVVRHDAAHGTWIFIAIHSSKLGPPTGGTRVKTYPNPGAALEDAMRLAEGMTYKFSVLGVNRGGAKAVIAVPENLSPGAREAVLLGYADLVERLAGGFETGPDMGTGSPEMDLLSRRTSHVFGKSAGNGGAGDPGPYTARGVLAGIRACCRGVFGTDDLAGRTILVQGAGHVGRPLLRLLKEAGAAVSFSDVVREPHRDLEEAGIRFVAPEQVYAQEVDVFAPCATGAILDEATIPLLRCRIVAGSANNQLATPDDADRLHARGILYAPDYVINSGGAIYLLGREGERLPEPEVLERIDRIGSTVSEILERSERESVTPARTARDLAAERLEGRGHGESSTP